MAQCDNYSTVHAQPLTVEGLMQLLCAVTQCEYSFEEHKSRKSFKGFSFYSTMYAILFKPQGHF